VKLLSILLLALFAFTAQAQVASNSAKLTWVNATTFVPVAPATVGDPLPTTGPEAIITTRIERSICNADGTFGTVLETLNVPITILTAQFDNLAAAVQCFHVRHIQTNGGMSAWSPIAKKITTLPALAKPKPPVITIS